MVEKRLRKIQNIELKKQEEQKIKVRKEEIFLKKSDARTKTYIYMTCFILVIMIAIPLMKKDPVQFWFVTIVIICCAAKVLIKR